MKQDFSVLKTVPLFSGMNAEEVEGALSCLDTRVKRYEKNQVLILAGEPVKNLGIVLSGRVQISREDVLGARSIVAEFGRGELFAESLSCARIEKSPVTASAALGCEIMWVRTERILSPCSRACGRHTALIGNMVRLLAGRNIFLNRKMEILSKKSIRERVLAYLNGQAAAQGTAKPKVPFTREELADFLCVNRSALSRELGKMRAERLIDFQGSRFTLFPGRGAKAGEDQ